MSLSRCAQIVRVYLLKRVMCLHSWMIRRLIVRVLFLNRRLGNILGAALLMDILILLILAWLVVLVIIGEHCSPLSLCWAFLLALARGLLFMSVLLRQPQTLWLLGFNLVCLSSLIPAPRILIRVLGLPSVFWSESFALSSFEVQQECFLVFLYIFQGQVSVSCSFSASFSVSFASYRSFQISPGGTHFCQYLSCCRLDPGIW